MKKRFLSVLLILCLVLSMTTTVFAAGGTFSGTVVPGGSGAGGSGAGSSSPNPNVPVTGDNTPLTLLIVLMGICAAATAAIIVSRKRTSR